MHRLKTAEVAATELVNVMAECVERFEHETGAAARLVTFDVDRILLSRRTCTELVRILREALANVRRHSGAQHVFVWFGADANRYALIVEDDGCGIAGASGSDTLALVDAGHLTQVRDSYRVVLNRGDWPRSADDSWRPCAPPASIAESVRAVGGTLTAYSSPGTGLRLEVTVPSARARASSYASPPATLAGTLLDERLAMATTRLATRLRDG
jgi:hypothetical protein